MNGVGLSLSVPVCSLAIYACIVFYAFSKVRSALDGPILNATDMYCDMYCDMFDRH